jgi:hypothetical protein
VAGLLTAAKAIVGTRYFSEICPFHSPWLALIMADVQLATAMPAALSLQSIRHIFIKRLKYLKKI